MCQVCQAEESIDHLFFRCPSAVFVWAVVRDSLEWKEVPKNVWDFRENFIEYRGGRGIGLMWFLFGAIC